MLNTYLECLQEDLLQGRLEEFCWVPTTSMLADGGSKVMADELAATLLRTGAWRPSEYKVLLRSQMDGSDTVDRQRQRQDGEGDDGYYPYVDYTDSWSAWFSGCTELREAGAGCGGTCHWCTGPHYDQPDEEVPLTFWLE